MVAARSAMWMGARRASIRCASEYSNRQNGNQDNFFHFSLSHFLEDSPALRRMIFICLAE
ncbi:TPA: hypothetical protein NPP50_000603 [Klebsiella variicola subsp. variicola]|nr:hypothetical protein [Klebsiella variicola subsp. variicola]